MAGRTHHYRTTVIWTGNTGAGTATRASYSRAHEITAAGKPVIPGSSDSQFRGDPSRWNPEELLLASLSTCHQLWYLDLCAQSGIVVTAYEDHAEATMIEEPGGAGQFTDVLLRPRVTVALGSDLATAEALHHRAHAMCFIARSVNFPVTHAPETVLG